MRSITVLAPAKVNLLLRVARPARPDGYHNVETILQTIDLCDVVEVSIARGQGVALSCSDPRVPCDASNLAARAALTFMGEPGIPGMRVRIGIEKHVPPEAGLGGGSSDASATLFALRALMAPEMPDGLVESLAADVGSDVPFFIRGGTQVALGRGEVLAPATQQLAPFPLAIAMPEGGCGTREVYARYDSGIGDGGAPALRDALRALSEGRFEDAVGNDLAPAAIAAQPGVGRVLDALRATGLAPVEVTGSGSACFGVARSTDDAVRAASQVADRVAFACSCSTRSAGCEVVVDG